MSDLWELFPVATLYGDDSGPKGFTKGAMLPLSDTCRKCPTRECWEASQGRKGISGECRFGINYQRLDASRLVVSIILTSQNMVTKRSKKQAKQQPEIRIAQAAFDRAVSRAASLGPLVIQDFDEARRSTAKELRSDPETLELVAAELRRDFGDTLGLSHDFLQLVKLVKGHAETLLQQKFPGLALHEAAERLPEEGAIFFSTELMLVKMDALIYLNEVNQAFDNPATFQAHPYLLKYVRIYRWQANQKELKISLSGESYGYYRYSSRALGAVFQGLLDNLVKYSPAGSDASIDFHEQNGELLISFISLGPRIDADEFDQIFIAGYRARAARTAVSDGLGVGLASAKNVSAALGLSLRVRQSPTEDQRFKNRYSTTFSLRLQGEPGEPVRRQ